MILLTSFFIYLTLGMAGTKNICQTESGTISDACLDEGNSFLQHAGSALSPKDVQPHNVQMEKEAVPQPKSWSELYEHWKKGKDAQIWSELYEHWQSGKGASLQDKEAPQEDDSWSKLFEHVHKGKKMVGMMKKKRKKVNASARLTEIEAIDCETMNQPLQVMRGPNGFDVKQLNIIDGTYELQFSIPWSVGGYSDMNACSIHPVDSIMYCVVFAGAPYLVRVDSTPRMEYVARIPWGTYISGAFAPATGRFYVSTLNAEFLIIDNVISMLSYSSKDDAADLRSMSRLKAPDWASTADCVAIDSDLEGNGIEEYIFSLYGARLQIAKYDNTTKVFSKTWGIKVMPRRWDNIFGAGDVTAPNEYVDVLNERFNQSGLLIRMLWNRELCIDLGNWSTLEYNGEDFDERGDEHGQAKYRAASYIRHDLPLAIANGMGFCEGLYRFGILLNPSTVRRGCGFWHDGGTYLGMNFEPGEDPQPDEFWHDGYRLCDVERSYACDEQCCAVEWEYALEKQKGCNQVEHNEYMVGYGKPDILAMVYTRHEGQNSSSLVMQHDFAKYLRMHFDLDVPIVEMRVPGPMDNKLGDREYLTHGGKTRPPFSVPILFK